jgi:hypothetical protein
MNHDRVVLRFNCLWDDSASLCGDVMHFTLHYFLSDDTVEVLEMAHANNGRDPFPKLLARQRLAKQWLTNDANGRSDEEGANSMMTWQDIKIGSVIPVYSRSLLVTDADPMTRDFYSKRGAPLDVAISSMDGDAAPKPVEEPPFNGWGTEKDSLANCKTLVPKAPKTEFDILGVKLEKDILRFKGKFADPCPDDACRKFIFSLYLCDGTIVVREPPERNSGVMGGKFLARGKFTNQATGSLVVPGDFFIGAKIKMTDFEFLITDIDEHTLAYMENRPQEFPQSSVKSIMTGLKAKLVNQAATGRLTQLFRKYDTDFSGKITMDEFAAILREYDDSLPDQAVITLMREFDTDGSGSITLDEFIQTIEGYDDDVGSGNGALSDADYASQMQAMQDKEQHDMRADALISQFTHAFLERGDVSSTLTILDPGRQGMLVRKVFKEVLTTTSSRAPWNYSAEQAEFLCEHFFGEGFEISFADFMSKVSRSDMDTGTRGHCSLHNEGDGGWK